MWKLLKRTALVAIGAAVAYLFDPVSGRGRRARLADQAGARARETADQVRKRADYTAGQMRGAAHEAFNRRDDEPADDAELLQKVRSEAIGPSGVPTDGFEVLE
ncbi:MAG: YtxH domain-containing protein, partial [Halobacteriales archaeon]|nr:YtxH domain-containing protein [Halobacteriales archaeon]